MGDMSWRMMIAGPWLIMYIVCLHQFYVADPKRWTKRELPFISGLLGEGHDDNMQLCIRFVAWSVAILMTCAARVVLVSNKKMMAEWVFAYYAAFQTCLITACWCAHPEFLPGFMPVSACVSHYIASALFFISGAAESERVNVQHFKHKRTWETVLWVYILLYCLLFVANKKHLVHLPHNTMPILELLMCIAHVYVDTFFTGRTHRWKDMTGQARLRKSWRKEDPPPYTAVPEDLGTGALPAEGIVLAVFVAN
jgi:hypothetical protein